MSFSSDSHHLISSSSRNGRLRIMLLFFLILLLSPFAKAQNGSNDGSDQSYPYNNLSPSMAVIIVILIGALFLMAFFTVYIRHCADSSNGSVRPLVGGTRRSRRAARGLDPAVIETFPTLEFSEVKIHHIGKGALECAVCLSEFEDSQTLRLLPKCDHVFHPECIDLWLASHTTCPVCRSNLVPQPGESIHGIPVLNAREDIEAQNDSLEPPTEQEIADADSEKPEPQTLSRSDTRGSRSSRRPRLPRSHTTGHSLVQPGENTERFTLRLPSEVRQQILDRKLHRASSLVILPREGSSRRGYRNGEGSSRGRFSRRLDRGFKSDKWVFTMAPPFLVRASSIRSPRVANSAGEGTSADPIRPAVTDSAQLPV